jgi:ankyrin repeat protein
MLLHLASYYGYPEKTMELLKYQPDVNAKNHDGSTPFQLCCLWTDSPETIRELLRSGADPAAVDGSGKNSLHLAFSAFFSSPEKLNAILEKISEVNVQDREGNTPLHHTMLRILRTGSWPALRNRIEILLKKGADLDIKNKEGKSVMDLASESGFGEIIDLMKKGR